MALESMNLDRQIGEVEKDLNVLEKKTHELSLSIENRGGADDESFATRMGERKALLDQKTELLEKRDGLRVSRQTAWDKEMEIGAINVAAKVDIPSERWTPETKALRELVQTGGEGHQPISIMDYFKAAEEGRPANGAAGEYNAHVFGSNRAGDFPIEFLHERDALLVFKPGDWDDIKESEHRAAITGTGVNPGASVNYISQLFANSEAAFCGASFPSVGVGDHSFPIFSKPTEIGDFARDAEEGDPGGSLTINTATNRRIQGSMELNAEDEKPHPQYRGGLGGGPAVGCHGRAGQIHHRPAPGRANRCGSEWHHYYSPCLPRDDRQPGRRVRGPQRRRCSGAIEHRARDAGDHPECIQSIVRLDSQQRWLPLLRATPAN